MEFYFQDQLRWSYGFENPNKAAALIASLLPLLWICWLWLSRFQKPVFKWGGRFVGAVILCAGWWLLFKTYSRGGIVAAVVAFTYIGFCSIQNFKRNGWGVGGFLVVIVGLFISTQAAQRSVGWMGNHEGSVENRFELWAGGLRMIAAIPQGVGSGQAGEMYMQWFQPLESTARYRTMVSSYLTFATERGIIISLMVLFAAMLLWFASQVPKSSNGFHKDVVTGLRASLVAFAVAGFFSTTMEEPLLWIVPTACMVGLVAGAVCNRKLISFPKVATTAGLVSLIVGIMVFTTGSILGRKMPVKISFHDGVVGVKASAPKQSYQVLVDQAVLGADYGKLLRRLAAEASVSLHVDEGEKFDPDSADTLLVTGDRVLSLKPTKAARSRCVLLAPSSMDATTAKEILQKSASVQLLLPGFDEDGRIAFWNDLTHDETLRKQVTVQVLEGVGTQVDWAWDAVISAISKQEIP